MWNFHKVYHDPKKFCAKKLLKQILTFLFKSSPQSFFRKKFIRNLLSISAIHYDIALQGM